MICPPRAGEPCAHEQHLTMLIERTADGDEQAFATFYDATSPLVFGFVRRILGDTPAAETVLCEVYEWVWREASGYTDEQCAPLTWLVEVARSRALDELRSGKREVIPDPSNDGARKTRSEKREIAASSEHESAMLGHLANCAVIAEGEKATRAMIAALSLDERQVLELAYFSGLRQDEIAARLKLRTEAVKACMRSALGKLSGRCSTSKLR